MSDGGGWDRIRALPFPELSGEQLLAICERHGFARGPFGRLPSTGIVNAIYTVGHDVVLRIPKNTAGTLADTFTELVALPVVMAAGVRTPDDVKDSNLLQRGGDYVPLIDWGDAGWGDAAIDFRNLPLFENGQAPQVDTGS